MGLNIMVNASNLACGGGLQVGDSICRYLNRYPQHRFTVVLSWQMAATGEAIANYGNVKILHYNTPNSLRNLLLGRDRFLDKVVEENKIDIVFSVFGMTKWKPGVPHLCGFAQSMLLQKESPYFSRMGMIERLKSKVFVAEMKFLFNKSSDIFYTENPVISRQLKQLFPKKEVHTITNFYHQVYDHPEEWDDIALPKFNGITLLTIGAAYPHKNLGIYNGIARMLKEKGEAFRIVLTIDESEFPKVEPDLRSNFIFLGRVAINQCPSLYKQADVMVQSTLLECFTATYPEAMRMGVPIVTTDLDFAHGLCGDAALYYSPLSAADATQKILEVYHNAALRKKLVEAGHKQLGTFDNNEQRADKVIKLLEEIYNRKHRK